MPLFFSIFVNEGSVITIANSEGISYKVNSIKK